MKKKYKIDEEVLRFFESKTIQETANILSMSYRRFEGVLKTHKVGNRNYGMLNRQDILKIYPWLKARIKKIKLDIRQNERLKRINSKEPKSSIGHGNSIFDRMMKKGKSVYWHYNPFKN